MRRRIRWFLLCLVLGMVTTVAVAWVLAIRVVVLLDGKPDFVQAEGMWSDDPGAELNWWCTVKVRGGVTVVTWEPSAFLLVRALSGGPGVDVDRDVVSALGSHSEPLPRPAVPHWAMRTRGKWPSHIAVASARGWPMRALWCESAHRSGRRTRQAGGLVVPRGPEWMGPGRLLPLRPIAEGFAVDSALYAAAWCVALFGPGRIRRALRRLRGRCPRCAYNLAHGGHDRCPECGWER